jgi:hypothetical protein
MPMVTKSELDAAIKVLPWLQKDIENIRAVDTSPERRRLSASQVLGNVTGRIRGYEEIKIEIEKLGEKLQNDRQQLQRLRSQFSRKKQRVKRIKILAEMETLELTTEKIERLHDEWTKKVMAENKPLRSLIEFLEVSSSMFDNGFLESACSEAERIAQRETNQEAYDKLRIEQAAMVEQLKVRFKV